MTVLHMNDSLPLGWGIERLRSAFTSRELSPVELLTVIYREIDGDQRGINAFVVLDREAALETARASEARYGAGRPLGPLDGIPSSIKDLINLRGWPTRRGSRATEGDPPALDDSPVAALLRNAGSPILGKTATSEFGWAPISESLYSGVTRNPLDLDRTAGGSSSGAAAQVAAGWGPLAIGNDAGGSVRVPAAYCGLVGFKPTHGYIPQAPLSALSDFSHIGPLTRNVSDCVEAMRILGAPDPRDPTSLYPRTGVREGARPLRIGWTTHFGKETVPDPRIAEATAALAAALASRGHVLEQIDLSWLNAWAAFWQVWVPRIYESLKDMPESRRALVDPRVLNIFNQGKRLEMPDLADGRIGVREIGARLAELFTRIDILISPTTPTVALPLGDLAPREHPLFGYINESGNNFAAQPYCYPFNVTQQPAISLPLGTSTEGLPFGAQIVGRRFHDAEVLELAREVEQVLACK